MSKNPRRPRGNDDIPFPSPPPPPGPWPKGEPYCHGHAQGHTAREEGQ
jgi:hypothetical protein